MSRTPKVTCICPRTPISKYVVPGTSQKQRFELQKFALKNIYSKIWTKNVHVFIIFCTYIDLFNTFVYFHSRTPKVTCILAADPHLKICCSRDPPDAEIWVTKVCFEKYIFKDFSKIWRFFKKFIIFQKIHDFSKNSWFFKKIMIFQK